MFRTSTSAATVVPLWLMQGTGLRVVGYFEKSSLEPLKQNVSCLKYGKEGSREDRTG